jgi:hypothetical protein
VRGVPVTPRPDGEQTAVPRRLIGYLCPKMPDGPMIPPHALYDPCGGDRAVYSDGTLGPDPRGSKTGGASDG